MIIKVFFGTIIAFLVFIAILFFVDPQKFKILAILPFYLSLFIFLWGLFFQVRYYLNILFKNKNKFYNFAIESFLLAFLVIGLLLLTQFDHFNIVNILFFFLFIILLEFILSKK